MVAGTAVTYAVHGDQRRHPRRHRRDGVGPAARMNGRATPALDADCADDRGHSATAAPAPATAGSPGRGSTSRPAASVRTHLHVDAARHRCRSPVEWTNHAGIVEYHSATNNGPDFELRAARQHRPGPRDAGRQHRSGRRHAPRIYSPGITLTKTRTTAVDEPGQRRSRPGDDRRGRSLHGRDPPVRRHLGARTTCSSDDLAGTRPDLLVPGSVGVADGAGHPGRSRATYAGAPLIEPTPGAPLNGRRPAGRAAPPWAPIWATRTLRPAALRRHRRGRTRRRRAAQRPARQRHQHRRADLRHRPSAGGPLPGSVVRPRSTPRSSSPTSPSTSGRGRPPRCCPARRSTYKLVVTNVGGGPGLHRARPDSDRRLQRLRGRRGRRQRRRRRRLPGRHLLDPPRSTPTATARPGSPRAATLTLHVHRPARATI